VPPATGNPATPGRPPCHARQCGCRCRTDVAITNDLGHQMTVGLPQYAGDMPATEAQVDSIKQDIRALSDTVSEILVTVNGLVVTVKDHGRRLDKVENRLDKIDDRFDKVDRRLGSMDSAIHEILTLVRREP